MDQRKKINDLLNRLNAQYDEYLTEKSFLYKIEKDIILAQVRELYELLAQIPVHHELEVGNEQELFSPKQSESLFDQPNSVEESAADVEELITPEMDIDPTDFPEETVLPHEVDSSSTATSDNPVSKLEKLLAELRGWNTGSASAAEPMNEMVLPEVPVSSPIVEPSIEETFIPEPPVQEVTFDLDFPPKQEERPNYFALERKVHEDEWADEQEGSTKPRVAIMNPFVGNSSPKTTVEETTTESAEINEPLETESSSISEELPIKDVNSYSEVEPEPASFSIAQFLNLNSETTLKAQLHLKPIDNLKTGIGLNEKFLYIRELFANDHITFANTIAQINDFDHIQQAEKLIQKQFFSTQKWDEKNPHVHSFLQLIYRRFA